MLPQPTPTAQAIACANALAEHNGARRAINDYLSGRWGLDSESPFWNVVGRSSLAGFVIAARRSSFPIIDFNLRRVR